MTSLDLFIDTNQGSTGFKFNLENSSTEEGETIFILFANAKSQNVYESVRRCKILCFTVGLESLLFMPLQTTTALLQQGHASPKSGVQSEIQNGDGRQTKTATSQTGDMPTRS